jgi:hypothetical protein
MDEKWTKLLEPRFTDEDGNARVDMGDLATRSRVIEISEAVDGLGHSGLELLGQYLECGPLEAINVISNITICGGILLQNKTLQVSPIVGMLLASDINATGSMFSQAFVCGIAFAIQQMKSTGVDYKIGEEAK